MVINQIIMNKIKENNKIFKGGKIMLNSKQRAQLKSLSVNEPTLFQVGKGGISDALIKQVDDALVARELIKIGGLETMELSAKETAAIIASKTHSDVVQVIGRKFVVYKRNLKDPKIILP